MIFYDTLLTLFAILSLPKLLYQMLFHKKYRKSLGQRFGIGFPRIDKGERQLVWIHAVSVGETKAVATLAKKLKLEMDNPVVVISSVTETGHAEAKRSIPCADYHVFLPLDFNWIIRPIIRKANPDLVILCETDFWFNFLKRCKKQGAKVALVNGKMSRRSLKRFLNIPWFSRKLFSYIDLFCVQSKHYEERFEKLGVSRDKIKVTGNLKFDGDYPQITPEDLIEWKKELGIGEDDQVLVVGSTHDPEEKLLLDLLPGVMKTVPNIKILVVPRHPERFNEVAKMIEQSKIPFYRLSRKFKKRGDERIILIDAMGLLRQCYQLADVALVAGSYKAKVGGHNIIEPSWYGKAVLFGPHMHSQPELLELVQKYQAGLQVAPEDLQKTLVKVLMDHKLRRLLGDNGARMVTELRGATDKTKKTLLKITEI